LPVVVKRTEDILSDADTVISNEGGKSPQIWSIAADYVAALNTKYQAQDPALLLYLLSNVSLFSFHHLHLCSSLSVHFSSALPGVADPKLFFSDSYPTVVGHYGSGPFSDPDSSMAVKIFKYFCKLYMLFRPIGREISF